MSVVDPVVFDTQTSTRVIVTGEFTNGKFAKIPDIKLLERLHTRNEYLIGSHHPLRETLMMQTGKNNAQRKQFLQKSFNFSRERLIHDWLPEQQGSSIF